jgi:hypothetical protein
VIRSRRVLSSVALMDAGACIFTTRTDSDVPITAKGTHLQHCQRNVGRPNGPATQLRAAFQARSANSGAAVAAAGARCTKVVCNRCDADTLVFDRGGSAAGPKPAACQLQWLVRRPMRCLVFYFWPRHGIYAPEGYVAEE